MNQLVTVHQEFLCTPLDGVWFLRSTRNLHGNLSDQLSTTIMLCTDMQTDLSGNIMKQVGGIKFCKTYRRVTCSQQNKKIT